MALDGALPVSPRVEKADMVVTEVVVVELMGTGREKARDFSMG